MTAYRQEYLTLKVMIYRRQQKQKAVEYKGGCCQKCGYDKCPAALEFHHTDPTKKDFSIGQTLRSFEKIRREIEKTILLCANCHREIHDAEALEILADRQAHVEAMAPKRGRPKVIPS